MKFYIKSVFTTPRTIISVMLLMVIAAGCISPEKQSIPDKTTEATSTASHSSTSIPPEIYTRVPPTAVATIANTNPAPTAQNYPGPDHFSSPYPVSPIEYNIPLTIRHIAPNSSTFFFELDQPATGRLVYKSNDPSFPEQGEKSFTTESARQLITLDGLSPGIPYSAKVILGDDQTELQEPGFLDKGWGQVDFKTGLTNFPIRFGVLGDAGFGDEATYQLVNLMAGYDLDFVLHTGDVVYEAENSDPFNSYITKYFEPFAPLLKKLPIYTVPGNHDYDTALRLPEGFVYDLVFPPFPDPNFNYPDTRRGNQYYAVSYGDVQFLMLDSQAIFGIGGREDQDAWLKERLVDPDYRITIPVIHVAPYSSSLVHPEDSLPVRSSWSYLFDSAVVPLVLSGHFHHYERLLANNITYIVSGGGSSTLYALGASIPESQFSASITHFVLVEIFKDRIQLSAISKDGETFDQATIFLN